jgi:hypothetical protein
MHGTIQAFDVFPELIRSMAEGPGRVEHPIANPKAAVEH